MNNELSYGCFGIHMERKVSKAFLKIIQTQHETACESVQQFLRGYTRLFYAFRLYTR